MSHLQRYGSGEAQMGKPRDERGTDKAAGGGGSDRELNTNKTRQNEMEKEWEKWEGDHGENSPRKNRG